MASLALNVGGTLGALELGVSVALFLFGVLTLQVYYYYSHHGGDGPYLKALAAIIWILELSRTIAMVDLNYHATITNRGTDSSSSVHTWALIAVIGICSLLDATFQIYYALRIKMVSKRWGIPLAAFCWCLSVVQFLLVMAILPLLFSMEISNFFMKHLQLLIIAFAIRVLLDFLTAMLLCYYTPRAEGRMSNRKWALLLIESGGPTFILGVATLIALVASSKTYVWFALAIILGVAQMNCFFAGLNSRHLWTSGLPLVELGKKPNVLAFYQPSKITDLSFGIHVDKSNSSSAAASMNEGHCPLTPK